MIRLFFLLFLLLLTALRAAADEYTDPVSNVVYSFDPEGGNAMVKARPYYEDEDADARLSDITGYSLDDYGVHGDIYILDHFIVDGKEYMVTRIGEGAFYYNHRITSVVIPETIESIGSDAFQLCETLKSVSLPNTLKVIGGAAFSRCSSLTSITIPGGVKTIESSAFWGCSSLSEVILGDGIESIGSGSFYNTAIAGLTIPASVNDIGSKALWIESLNTVTSLIEDPSEVGDICDFENSQIKLFVPKGTKEKYKACDGWNLFNSIEEIEVTGIGGAPHLDDNVEMNDKRVGVYDLQGRRINGEPKRGLYIRDGKKVIK